MLSWRNRFHPCCSKPEESSPRCNYRAILGFEDWDLWLRLSHKGEVLENLPDVLVDAAVDKAHLYRRQGFAYANLSASFFFVVIVRNFCLASCSFDVFASSLEGTAQDWPCKCDGIFTIK